MDPYLVPDDYGGHVISPDSIEPADWDTYFARIQHRATVSVENHLWQSIHVDGAVDMIRVRLEALYQVETERLVLREKARRIRSDNIYIPLEMEMIQAHLAPVVAAIVPPPPAMAPPAAVLVAPIDDLDGEDDDDEVVGVVPVIDAGIDVGIAIKDLEGEIEPAPEVNIVAELPEPPVELDALEDAPPLESDDDGSPWTTVHPSPRTRGWRRWPVVTIRYT